MLNLYIRTFMLASSTVAMPFLHLIYRFAVNLEEEAPGYSKSGLLARLSNQTCPTWASYSVDLNLDKGNGNGDLQDRY